LGLARGLPPLFPGDLLFARFFKPGVFRTHGLLIVDLRLGP
jgi:hypothetical protein